MAGGTHKERKRQNGNGAPAGVIALPHGRVPPHNLDAERSLLGGVLLDRAAPLRELAEICSASDFYRDAHRKIFEAVLSLLEDGIEVDRVSLTDRLLTRGDLEAAGGADYLDLLDKIVPTAANLSYYAKIVHEKARARRLIETASAIAQLGYEQHGDVADFLAEAEKRIRGVVDDEGQRARRRLSIAELAIRLSAERIRAKPPERRFMLRDGLGAGRYPQGKVGLFVGTGGAGKTWTLFQLTAAVSTGTGWFGRDGWWPEKPGRVLSIFGEEEMEEALRTLHFAAAASGIESDDELELLSRNATILGMAGQVVSLTLDDGMPADFAFEISSYLRAAADAGNPFTLVIFDPLSRFAGPDVETDNYAATRFIQVLESFASDQNGKPSIIIAHHMTKWRPDDSGDSADVARGASAIKDGARWMARLDQVQRTRDSADLLTLRIVKANGIPPQRTPLILCRSQFHEGALRLATKTEVATNEKLGEFVRSKVQELEDYKDRVIEVLATLTPVQEMSANKLVEICGNRPGTLEAVRTLLKERRIVHGKKYFKLPSKQADLFTGSEPGTTSGTTSPKGPDLAGSAPLAAALSPQRAGNHQGPTAPEPAASGGTGTGSVPPEGRAP